MPGHRPVPLTEPVALGPRTAGSRVLFGPHVTNLAHGRAVSDRHAAYYGRRAAGGAGVIVVETASVHDSDHPYERAPRAGDAGEGWAAVVEACRPHGALVLAGLGHAGSQGSSDHHQRVLWAPSPVPDPVSREMPHALEEPDRTALVAGFAAATALAAGAGLDGVEIQAGQHALLRQFLSGLTNLRTDRYGGDDAGRRRLLLEVLAAVRAALGPGRVLGLRLGVDELAPWAGVTPAMGAATALAVGPWVDYVVPVRGSGLSVAATRPDAHTPAGFGIGLARTVRAALGARAGEGSGGCSGRGAVDGPAVVLAGSVVDPGAAQDALDEGAADLVEMTRAQVADPSLVTRVRAGRTPRPCVLTNQQCRARDVRNPVVSCAAEPDAGYETAGAAAVGPGSVAPGSVGPGSLGARPVGEVLVVGGGPAGLEGARVLAAAGHRVRLVERDDELGGVLRLVARLPGRERFTRLADWLVDEALGQGVDVRPGTAATAADVDAAAAVLVATGAADRPVPWEGVPVRSAAVLLGGASRPTGPVVVDDPLGDGTGVAVAEMLAARGARVATPAGGGPAGEPCPVVLVTPDPVVGKGLARTGDLVDAHRRLQRAGVHRALSSEIVSVAGGRAHLRDVVTGVRTSVSCAWLVDCGPRRATDPLGGPRPGLVRAGDAVAPRTVHEALREGRRAAEVLGGWAGAATPVQAGADTPAGPRGPR